MAGDDGEPLLPERLRHTFVDGNLAIHAVARTSVSVSTIAAAVFVAACLDYRDQAHDNCALKTASILDFTGWHRA